MNRRMRQRAIWFGLGGVGMVVLAVFAVCAWVVPGLIASRVSKQLGCRVEFRSWWVSTRSAGLRDVVLHHGKTTKSAEWGRIETIRTDLTFQRLLSGNAHPGVVQLVRPTVSVKLDRAGQVVQPKLEPAGPPQSSKTEVRFDNATVRIEQEGRPAMEVAAVSGSGTVEGPRIEFRGWTNDPRWGSWRAKGRVDQSAQEGEIRIVGGGTVSPEKVAPIPFVPTETWQHIKPTGPVAVSLTTVFGPKLTVNPSVAIDIDLNETNVRLPDLELDVAATKGQATFRDGLIEVRNVSGITLGGSMTCTEGQLDFRQQSPRVRVALKLDGIDVARTPKAWHLDELAATGDLSGTVLLQAQMDQDRIDLTGSTGRASIVNATVGGIPVKRLGFEVRAEGSDLRYETGESQASSMLRRFGRVVSVLALQAPAPPAPKPTPPTVELPKFVNTELELEDVDLAQLVKRAEGFGVKIPIEMSGKLSVKAKAVIPLRTLNDIKAYTFHGEAVLRGASIAGVDLGRLDAKLDLDQGVLVLSEFRGRLLDRPAGNATVPPEATEPPPATGPMPPGSFRATLRAELAPPGFFTAKVEGTQLPLGELTAPILPRPTPLAGHVDLMIQARSAVNALGNPHSWTIEGTVRGSQVVYNRTVFGDLAARIEAAEGVVRVPSLALTRDGKPYVSGLRAEVKLPPPSGGPLQGTVSGKGLDTSLLASAVPGGALRLTGTADVVLNFTVPGQGTPRSPIDAKVRLDAPDLTIQGIPAESVRADLNVHDRAIGYAVEADSLGGKVRVRGDIPINLDPQPPARPAVGSTTDFNVHAVRFSVARALAAIGERQPGLDGLGAFEANVRIDRRTNLASARAVAEVRDLRWSGALLSEALRATVASDPGRTRLDQFQGEILGSPVTGQIEGTALPAQRLTWRYMLNLNRLDFARLAAFFPDEAGLIEGVGTLRLNGTYDRTARGNLELRSREARIAGWPLTDLRVPAEYRIGFTPFSGQVGVRAWSARLEGGSLSGEATVRFSAGGRLEYQGQLQVASVDLEPLARLATSNRSTATGRVEGRVTFNGADFGPNRRLQGKVDMALTEASVFELPVFRELSGFLGSARGGLFDEGRLNGTLSNREFILDELFMTGKLAQLYAKGTIGYDSQLRLDVLVNTNEIIPTGGSGLISLIPGLREVRGAQAIAKVAGFLSNRLLKFRVTGTIRQPVVTIDPSVLVTDAAVTYFTGVFGLPLSLLR